MLGDTNEALIRKGGDVPMAIVLGSSSRPDTVFVIFSV